MGGDAELKARVAELELLLAAEVELRERLVGILGRLGSSFDRDELLRTIVATAADALQAEAGSLLLVDAQSGDLTVAVATGSSEPDMAGSRIAAGQGFAGWVVQHREPVVTTDPARDHRFYPDVDAAGGFETTDLLAVPLLDGDRAVGVLELVNKLGDGGGFDAADLALAGAFTGLAVIALDRASR